MEQQRRAQRFLEDPPLVEPAMLAEVEALIGGDDHGVIVGSVRCTCREDERARGEAEALRGEVARLAAAAAAAAGELAASRALTAEQLAASVRARWGVENRFHWILDVSFSEDASMVAKDNAPQNLSLLRKIALNVIRADKTDTRKSSLRLKRKGAARDDGVREPHAGDQIDMLGECGGPALQPSWSSVASIVYITRQSTP